MTGLEGKLDFRMTMGYHNFFKFSLKVVISLQYQYY